MAARAARVANKLEEKIVAFIVVKAQSYSSPTLERVTVLSSSLGPLGTTFVHQLSLQCSYWKHDKLLLDGRLSMGNQGPSRSQDKEYFNKCREQLIKLGGIIEGFELDLLDPIKTTDLEDYPLVDDPSLDDAEFKSLLPIDNYPLDEATRMREGSVGPSHFT
ncbi:hypothetical protein Pfo_022554 [Paulownia fortunei]|nr:hypothetical protein Pfo_022554 [Paulownia fortunei]